MEKFLKVQSVLKTFYGRYKLQHTSSNNLRRGSRALGNFRQKDDLTNSTATNGNYLVDRYCKKGKKKSDCSAKNLMNSTVPSVRIFKHLL